MAKTKKPNPGNTPGGFTPYSSLARLIEVHPTDDFHLIATYDDGKVFRYDFNRIFQQMPGDAAQALRDLTLFKTVVVEAGDFHWDNDFDLSGDSIYLNGIPISSPELS
jgi:hypothetical protein